MKLLITVYLSNREKQVVDCVVRGLANKEIAFELHLAYGSVKEYMNRIFRKTGATNRTQLAMMAVCEDALLGLA